MASPAEDLNKTYTYTDYLSWPDEERWEIIEGRAYPWNGDALNMAEAPIPRHQRVLFQLARLLGNYLEGKPCEVYPAPLDVILTETTVVQPDISVICDSSKINSKGCEGAPDLIVEILSPTTAKKDLSQKFNLYEKSGVKEYWIVHPHEMTLFVYQLKRGKLQLAGQYAGEDEVTPRLFPELIIDLKVVFGIRSTDQK